MNIDLHFHHTPRFFLDELGGANPWGKSLHGAGDALSIRIGKTAIPISPEHWDIGRTLEVMDARRIDVAALSPSPMLFHTQWPLEIVLPLHRRVNDVLAEIARTHRDRFAPLGTVPLQDADAARRELERCMEIGLAGVEIETHAAGRNLDDPSLRSFFGRAAELGAVIFLHPLAVLGAERLARHYLTNLIGNPTDTAVAVASLICGGVLEELPDLKIVCAHGGGSTPMLCGRWDHGARVRPELAHLERLPSESLRRLYFDSLTHSSESLELLVRTVGAERIVLGSDYPYDMGDERAVERIETATFLSPREKRLVLGETASALLGRG
ncbi:MAG TPA: amidohydrolase family protein [Candidatus Binatia bacterium]|nr:amidohydrolase family protein [Candidatus Binatia bacterium]